MKRYPVSDKLASFANIFRENGYSLYLVGGAVRDFLLKKENHDYDFTTDAEPEDVKRIFRKTIDTGIKHGTVTVLFKGDAYEVTTFRSDGDYHDGRHPDSVKFIKNLSEDLKRRDFTINALAASLPDGKIIDEHDGIKDLKRKTIRAIGDAEKRFEEDALRMLRACRFASKLSFNIESETLSAIKKMHENVKAVSAERIKEEVFALILSNDPIKGLEYMRETLLMEDILPELYRTYGFEQGGIHKDDLYHHLLRTLHYAKENNHSPRVRIAALFHDVGKYTTREEGDDRDYTFFGHDRESARIFESIALRLKTSNEERESVAHLIEDHMFSYTPDWTDAAVRRFIKRVGFENIDDLIDLRIDDAYAISGGRIDPRMLLGLIDRVKEEVEKEAALSLKDLNITGNDLIKEGIMKPSKKMGEVLNLLLDEVIENPEKNTRDYLLHRASELCQGQ